jgi:DNA-binding CsgD family transcriptional regulator
MGTQGYDEDRYTTQRGRYIAKTTDLREPEAKAVAYSERGYSFDGIAKELDTGESTVQGYIERAMALYGLEAAETILPSEEPEDLERVDPEYFQTLQNRSERNDWLKFVKRHQEKLPADWSQDVLDAARETGVNVTDL